MKLIKGVYVFAIIGIFIGLLSAILFLFGSSWADAVGVFSTVISIVLGLVSIIYTYKSGEDTTKALNEIREENRSLVSKINQELSKNNFDEVNLQSLLKK